MSTSTDGSDAAPLLDIARVRKAHGLRGELLVDFTTDRSERWTPGAVLHGDLGDLTVASARPHQNQFLVSFEEIADRTAAERWRGQVLRAPAIDDPDEAWVHELIGSSVVTVDGTECGVVRSVVANPAADLLDIEGGLLVPMNFVVDGPTQVDGRWLVRIDPPDGLLDLNSRP